MMSFCKRSVHSFLGSLANNSNINVTVKSPPPPPPPPPPPSSPPSSRSRKIPSPIDGLSLITTRDIHRSTNILESPIIKPNSSTATKNDPGGVGFVDDIKGGVDGLMSCTESLGFESSDERTTDDQIDQEIMDVNYNYLSSSRTRSMVEKRRQWRKKRIPRSEPKKYPPPLSSLKQNGQPNFYLRPVRKDGRLELTEVRITRPEILHASRGDGRLRLHLIPDNTTDINEEEEDREELEEEIDNEKIEELVQADENGGDERVNKGGEWKLPMTNNSSGGGDGFRRCYELVNHHHHNHHGNLQVWSQYCVPTR